jgi:hypothetical protein
VAENTFVIRIWCEHSEQESVKPQFRGVIEHVISGQRQYLADTKVIIQFIQTHLPNYSHTPTNTSQPLTQWIDEENR